MWIGMSPCDTAQVSCAKAPESTIEEPKENGIIRGGSKIEDIQAIIKSNLSVLIFPVGLFNLLITIDPQFS